VKRRWETITDRLRKAGWRCGCISRTDHKGRQFWVAAAEREGAGRFIVHADDMPTAFMELVAAIRACSEFSRQPNEIFLKLDVLNGS
jgi:hypothetical protein